MGLSVALQDEDGRTIEVVLDSKNHLHRLLPPPDDVSYPYLRFIDWYGDTVFNRLQIEGFLNEWAKLKERAMTEDERELILRIEKLAYDCQAEPHLYLKFIGD
jgi:hypothetical protein